MYVIVIYHNSLDVIFIGCDIYEILYACMK